MAGQERRDAGRPKRGRPVAHTPAPATEPRRAVPGPVKAYRAQMVSPLDRVEPARGHTLVPGRGWVPDMKREE